LKITDLANTRGIDNNQSQLIKTRTNTFNQTLTNIQTENKQKLADFLDRLDTVAQRLAQSFSLTDLHEFQKTVREFLKNTFGKSSTLLEESTWDVFGRPKILARIAKINAELDELGKEYLLKNKDQLQLLKKIDKIRGLIIDIFT